MEHRLAVHAALALVLGGGRIAAADHKDLARQLFELGIEEYKDKQYDAAAASMAKSYALDAQPTTLYALAQSERLANNCKDALVHYDKLLETSKDDSTTNAVKAQIDLCKQIEAGAEVKAAPAVEVEKRDAPVIQYRTRTVVRTERHSDVLGITLFAVGGTALGGAATTYLLYRSARDDEARAQTLAQYNEAFDHANTLRWTSYTAAGVGAVLVGIATVRAIRGTKPRPTDVAVLPLHGGAYAAWSTSW